LVCFWFAWLPWPWERRLERRSPQFEVHGHRAKNCENDRILAATLRESMGCLPHTPEGEVQAFRTRQTLFSNKSGGHWQLLAARGSRGQQLPCGPGARSNFAKRCPDRCPTTDLSLIRAIEPSLLDREGGGNVFLAQSLLLTILGIVRKSPEQTESNE
jgi:hypothetical protein